MSAKLPRQSSSDMLRTTLDDHLAGCPGCRWAVRRFLKASTEEAREKAKTEMCGYGRPVLIQYGRALVREAGAGV